LEETKVEIYYWRGKFFNRLIKELNYSSYLELGVSTGQYCWNVVECSNKVGVDSNPDLNIPGVVCSTTDEYFKSLNPDTKYDLIFIDAFHEKYQVYADFCNSLKHLNPGGIIVLHDIYPLNKENCNINTSNGNVYEFWIELVNNYENETSVVIGNPGDDEGTIGIFIPNNDNFYNNLIKEINHSYEYFSENIDNYISRKTFNETEIIEKIKKRNQK
jgi:hypothetical protein